MRFVSIIVAVVMCGAVTLTSASAQDPATSAQVNQAELARMLVNVTGMARFLPAPSTYQENFAALLANGISPVDGWVADKVVTKADLARVTVQALGREDEVENPDDPNSWVKFLKENGIPIDTVGQAVDNVDPIVEPVAGYVFAAGLTTDPLKKIQVFGEPDEKQFGADVQGIPPTGFAPPPLAPAPVAIPTPSQPRSTPVTAPVTREQVRRVVIQVPTPEPPTTPVTPAGGEDSAVGQALVQLIINGIIDGISNPPADETDEMTPPPDVTETDESEAE